MQYYRAGRVELVLANDERVEAWVEGRGDDYFVQIVWDEDGESSHVSCTCPHFADGYLCKHLWATLLETDDQFFSTQPAPAGRSRGRRGKQKRRKKSRKKAPQRPAWMRQLDTVEREFLLHASHDGRDWQADLKRRRPREIWYVIDVAQSNAAGGTVVQFLQRETRANGEPGKIKPLTVDESSLSKLADSADQDLLDDLLHWSERTSELGGDYYRYSYSAYKTSECRLPAAALKQLLPRLCETGRLVWRLGDHESPEDRPALVWDDGPPWRLQIDVREDPKSHEWMLSGFLVRGDDESIEECPLRTAVFVDTDGAVLFEDRLARFEADHESSAWLATLRKDETIRIPPGDREAFVERVGRSFGLTAIQFPNGAATPVVEHECRPRLRIISDRDVDSYSRSNSTMFAKIDFLYGEMSFDVDANEPGRVDAASNASVRRQPERESAFLAQLADAQFKPAANAHWRRDGAHVQFPRRKFVDVVHTLTRDGWIVEADGRPVRQPGSCQVSVKSDVDWFELEANFDFGGATATLPSLLAAVRKGDRFVQLDDGSQGMLPEEWLRKYGQVAMLGEASENTVRFRPSQAMLLDALLDAQPAVDVDRMFRQFTKRLRSFSGVKPKSPPRTFRGTLREYQREGLSWLHFLREFRLGGCLADDMGLGKTVQVLALLESRRTRRLKKDEQRHPSLVVVPRSLIFNWIDEAGRFTPKLRVMNYTGLGRKALREQFDEYDVIVTTYGTLRRDIAKLKDTRFDYAILDESQAIKNAESASAKACRLVSADHRLAMTGTPVENHLGELWSLFEFLNPGMLGRSTAFKNVIKSDNGAAELSLALLAASLKPYLLRRTKEQVLTELPEKTEQTLYCEMPKQQRQLYDELRNHYRSNLQQRIDTAGLEKSKIHVLEALLRLRQAACHPGLIDKARAGESSAKLDALLEQLDEVISEGHKALVFSQFTSLLSIVRDQLDARKTTYEYLDGQTRKRQNRVERFQTDPDCPLFLISLKAGGHGLNLTAADYVFILDPWWNPAVEAQAVDRAHRIGQDRHVFAYRLICSDTVEQRILDLQQRKRDLADAIVAADNSLVSNLTADDLQLLLS
jgi:superfamily II DNA or RNA helicase